MTEVGTKESLGGCYLLSTSVATSFPFPKRWWIFVDAKDCDSEKEK